LTLLHPRWRLHGPITRYTGWQPSYPEAAVIDYRGTTITASSDHSVQALLDRLNPEERGRFERQILRSNELLLQAGERHLELQALPIGNPDPAPKRRVVQQKRHGKADARGLTGAELAERALLARERAQRAADEEDGLQFVPDTPPRSPRLAGESQGGSTITLVIRSPERPPTPRHPLPAPSFLPPSSTAPPTLGGAMGKRKRTMTDKYREGREEGLNPSIGHSQQDSTPR
jgi:hypothetical protein